MNTKLNVKKEAVMKVLASALDYLHLLDVTNNQLYQRYGLRPETLANISVGCDLARGADKYLNALVMELMFQMEYADEEGREGDYLDIQAFLAEQMIALHGNFEF